MGTAMMTGRKTAIGISGIGLTPARKTPLSAALQITASQSVNGTITAEPGIALLDLVQLSPLEPEPEAELDQHMDEDAERPRSSSRSPR